MFRAQTLQASGPLVDVHAMIGDTHADVLVGGGDGNVLAASVDDLAGVNADVNVDAAGNLAGSDMDGCAGIGTGVEVDGHVALGALGYGVGLGADANIDLDGALINAAASVDPIFGSPIDSAAVDDCGCSGTSASMDAGADISIGISDLGLVSPLSLSSLDLSGIDLFCGDQV